MAVRGVETVVRALGSVVERVNEMRSRAIREVAEQIVRDIKAGAPVDTGNLRDSVSMEIVVNEIIPKAVIKVEAEYASFVEFGTSRMRAQPFVMPVLDQVRDRLMRQIRLEMGGLNR
jgi:HK97 gp10 family phage protein